MYFRQLIPLIYMTKKGHLHNIQIILEYFYLFKKTSFYLLTYNNPLQL